MRALGSRGVWGVPFCFKIKLVEDFFMGNGLVAGNQSNHKSYLGLFYFFDSSDSFLPATF